MKLRIYKDSIRFRFTRDEAKALGEGSALAEYVAIGPLEEQRLAYRVVPNGTEGIRVAFTDRTLTVYVPQLDLLTWYEGENLTLEATQSWNGGHVRLSLEKDLQRLNPKPGEEPKGVYSHPLFGIKHCDHP
ncbi:MAG: hypothetical protein JNM66_21385 [Bryobacterales bacterium]|nr:hypothetical protein [Bryobacterales bacterium]